PPVCHCFGVNVTVTASPYFAQIRQNCLPESGKFARFFDHRVSVSFCAFFCALFEVVYPPASRVISGFALFVCVIDFVIGFMIDLRTFLRIFSGDFSEDFFGDFSPPSMRLVRGFEGAW
ncbi:hypothetical protein ABNB09_005147, partial [Escherichia coli]